MTNGKVVSVASFSFQCHRSLSRKLFELSGFILSSETGRGYSFPKFLTYLAQGIVIKAFIASFERLSLFERDVQLKKTKNF